MPRDLKGRTILITGGSSGIGAATAVACARAGMDVAICGRREDRLRQVAGQIESLGRRAVPVVCDVESDEQVRAFVRQTLDTFGRLDVAYANAGFGIFGSVLQTTDAQARSMFETNYWGTVRVLRAAAGPMLAAGAGHLVVCSSALSELGIPMYGHYSATKAAQDGLVSAMRGELAGTGVYVSSVHPVGTRTEFFETSKKISHHERFNLNTAAFLFQKPERVANAIVRCLRRPRPEVWTSYSARLGLAMVTAFPRFGAWAMRFHVRGRQDKTP